MRFKFPLIVAALTVASTAQAGAIVSAKDSPLQPIDEEMAKRVFLGREFELNGQPLRIIYQGEGDERKNFETRVLGKTGAALTAHWSKLIFTGKANAPMEAGGDDGVKALLQRTPGGVGYISDQSIDNSVKVLYRF